MKIAQSSCADPEVMGSWPVTPRWPDLINTTPGEPSYSGFSRSRICELASALAMSSADFPKRTLGLPQSELFKQPVHDMNPIDRALLSYEKARAFGLSYSVYPLSAIQILVTLLIHSWSPIHRIDLSFNDIFSLTPKFWQIHHDPAILLDCGATTLLIIQYNLCAGTIARYSNGRQELVLLVEELLRYHKQ